MILGDPLQSARPTTARKAAVAVIAVLTMLVGWHAHYTWNTTEETSERLLMTLARTLEFQADTSFRGIDALLAEASQRIDPAHWPDPALTPWFQSRIGGYPEVSHMVVGTADGRSVGRAITQNGPVGGQINMFDREFFHYHAEHPHDRGMHIGDPIISHATGQPGIPLSRALLDSNGRFLGVVVITIDPEYLIRAFAPLLLEDAGAISLIRADGIFLARLPDSKGSFGRSTAASPLFQEFLPKSKSGIARFVSVTDGNAKLVAYRTLERYPLVATVGITRRSAFGEFWTETIWSVLTLSLAALVLYRLAALADRRMPDKTDRD